MECQKMLQNNEWRELPQDPFQSWLFLAVDQGWAWTVQKFTNSSFVHEQLNFWTNEQSFFSTEWTNEQVNSCSFLVGNFWTFEQLMTKSSWTFEQMNSCSFTVRELLNKRTDNFSGTNEQYFLPRTFEQMN